jgi:hypothetical protein
MSHLGENIKNKDNNLHRNKLMIEFAGTLYYIDLDAFNNLILLETKENFVTTEKENKLKRDTLRKQLT